MHCMYPSEPINSLEYTWCNRNVESMNTSTRVHTNTKQIMDVLSKRPLSFWELSRKIDEDDESLSQDVDEMVQAGVVTMRFHNHRVQYKLAQRVRAAAMLQRLDERLKKV